MFCIGCIISIVYECRVNGITQSKVVTTFLRSIDKGCKELLNEEASNIARGAKNTSIYVKEALVKLEPDDYGEVVEYFQNSVLGLIKENERNMVRDALLMIIQDESTINDDTVVDIIAGVKKKDLTSDIEDLGSFLAGLFLYALKNTKNNIGGGVKKYVKEYLEKAKEGKKHTKNNVMEHMGEVAITDHEKYISREVELMEERILQEATAFCMKYEQHKDFISLCQIAHVTDPTSQHSREMYNDYCLCTLSTQKKILEMNGIEEIAFSNEYWWGKYFACLERDYEKFALGHEHYQYMFAQYFPLLLQAYKEKSITDCLERLFPVKVETSMTRAVPSYRHDVIRLIDEYMFYNNTEKYKDTIEPPMDYMWTELNLGSCEERKLAAFLALFIIGVCHAVPIEECGKKEAFAYSGPITDRIETAEDLFYLTILTLYETYNEDELILKTQ